MRILYVEDDPRDIDLARRSLAKNMSQFELDTAVTQAQALEKLDNAESPPYDLVMTDLRLPDGDGLELVNHIRQQALPLAAVVITGRGDEETAVAVLKAGADDYIVKHRDYLTRLPRVLEEALNRYRAEAARRARALLVLYAEHHTADIDLTRRHLARHAPHIHLEVVHTAPEVRQSLKAQAYDVILLDYRLPGLNALELLKEWQQSPDRAPLADSGTIPPVVLVTGEGAEEVAVQALKLGAADYVVKNRGYLFRLPSVLENAFYRVQLSREQAALRKSEARFRTLFETMVQGVVYQAANGEIISANPSAERILGLTLDQMQGRTSMDPRWRSIHEDGSDFPGDTHPAMVSLKTGQEVRDVIMGVYNPRLEDYCWVNVNAVPQFKPGEDRPYQVYTTFEDITVRKKAKEALQQYAQRLQTLHEIDQAILAAQAPEAIAGAALSLIRQLVPFLRASVSEFNPETGEATMLAVHAEGETNLGLGSHYPVDSERFEELRQGKVHQVQDIDASVHLDPSIETLHAEGVRSYLVLPLLAQGTLLGSLNLSADESGAFSPEHVEIAREVADQLAVALQQALLRQEVERHAEDLEWRVAERTAELAGANERLREMDRLKDEFVSNVSHELRGPLSNIRLYQSLIERGKEEKRPHYFEILHRETSRLGGLIEDLLDLSRLDQAAALATQPVDLGALIADALTNHMPQAESRQIQLELDAKQDLPLIQANPAQITQVLTNLVSNALSYTPPDGHVTVRPTLSERESRVGLLVSVIDDGPGISQKDLPHLFERFYRGQVGQESGEPGTGLGLSICKKIVDLHGGHIGVESREGEGSTFWVWLPLQKTV